jgi:hypothetical protein
MKQRSRFAVGAIDRIRDKGMNKVICFIIIGAILIITGCGAMLPTQDRLSVAARYGELERHMEAKVSSMEQAQERGHHAETSLSKSESTQEPDESDF